MHHVLHGKIKNQNQIFFLILYCDKCDTGYTCLATLVCGASSAFIRCTAFFFWLRCMRVSKFPRVLVAATQSPTSSEKPSVASH